MATNSDQSFMNESFRMNNSSVGTTNIFNFILILFYTKEKKHFLCVSLVIALHLYFITIITYIHVYINYFFYIFIAN